MQSELTIPGASGGPFWDGGIIDYHFTLKANQTPGLVLYPHFRDRLTPAWFDKMPRWRTPQRAVIDQLVLMCPRDAFLPHPPAGTLTDRSELTRIPPPAPIAE